MYGNKPKKTLITFLAQRSNGSIYIQRRFINTSNLPFDLYNISKVMKDEVSVIYKVRDTSSSHHYNVFFGYYICLHSGQAFMEFAMPGVLYFFDARLCRAQNYVVSVALGVNYIVLSHPVYVKVVEIPTYVSNAINKKSIGMGALVGNTMKYPMIITVDFVRINKKTFKMKG